MRIVTSLGRNDNHCKGWRRKNLRIGFLIAYYFKISRSLLKRYHDYNIDIGETIEPMLR